MNKRELGFDPANGEWDYAIWETGPGLIHTAAQSTHCGGCHAGAADADFVFDDVEAWLGQ